MTTRSRRGPLLTVPLDPGTAAPLFRQLYEGLRHAILVFIEAPALICLAFIIGLAALFGAIVCRLYSIGWGLRE